MEKNYENVLADLYYRVSDEDLAKGKFKDVSESINNQRELCRKFCLDNGITIHGEYFDDGISGTTFDRPGFQDMIKDIENKVVNCVITKDSSRFGRDHIVTGHYIEKYFPENKIRYISVTDNWDSQYDPIDILLFRMTFNDIYCKDISKKVCSALDIKRKQGLYVGSFAPYGYIKDPNDKNHLIPDEEVAYIVKEIFEMASKGMGTSALAKYITSKGYKTPGKHCHRGHPDPKIADIWTTGMIRRILCNQAYCGDTVQSKRKKISYKSKKIIKKPEEDWDVVKDTHEPLVSREIFAICSEIVKQNSIKYTRSPQNEHLLGKILYCKDCGRRISIQWSYKDKKKYKRSGVCGRYKKYSKYGVCTPHYIDYDALEEQVINYTKNTLTKYLEYLDTPALIQENYKEIRKNISSQESIRDKIINEKIKAEQVIIDLYEDKSEGKITESIFDMISKKKQKEIDDYDKQITNLNDIVNQMRSQLDRDKNKINDTKKIIKGFLKSEVLTQDTIYQIIDKIEVDEDKSLDVWFRVKEINLFIGKV